MIVTHSIPFSQVLVKSGVSKCQECNIVFCKHENYVAHKKHYCSARVGDTAEDGFRTSPGSLSPASTKDSSVSTLTIFLYNRDPCLVVEKILLKTGFFTYIRTYITLRLFPFEVPIVQQGFFILPIYHCGMSDFST